MLDHSFLIKKKKALSYSLSLHANVHNKVIY